MTPRRPKHPAILAAALSIPLLTGCQSPPSNDKVFGNVQSLTADRGVATVQWNRNTAQDQQAAEAVQKLLADQLDVDEAIQIALLNNRHLQAAYERLGIAQADLVEAGLLRNPVFHAEIGFPEGGGTEADDGFFEFGAADVFTDRALCHPTGGTSGDFNGPTLDLAVAFDFIDILFLPLRTKIAAEHLKATEAEVAGVILDLAGRVRSEFFTHQSLLQNVEMRQTQLDATDASFELAQRLHAAGNLDDLRLAQERAEHEHAKLELATAEADVTLSRERLNRLMGLWGNQTQWTADPRLPELPPEEPAWENVEAQAIEKSLDLQSAKHRLFALAQRAGVSRQEGLVPSADVGISGTRADDGENWVLGPTFSIPIPLFNWGQAGRARAMSDLRQARQNYYATAVDLRSLARSARARLRAARHRADHYQRILLPLQEQIVTETQKRYNAMFESPFVLLSARRQQLEMEGQAVAALRDYWLARAELEQILNGRMPTSAGEMPMQESRPMTPSFHSESIDVGH